MSYQQIGLAVGKFYPPHVGHHKLIDTAVAECDTVFIGVCWSSRESISVEDRIEWLLERHPEAIFFPIHDDSPVLYTDETWSLFLDALMKGLSGPAAVLWKWPNVIYSGEAYVPDFARRLWEKYQDTGVSDDVESVGFRKLNRDDMPGVSATTFRAAPEEHWDNLSPSTKGGLCKRIVVCGAESSGTTTLAKALGRMFKTPFVPEYGRYYDEAMGKHHEWVPEDFEHIASEQKRWEDNFAQRSNNGVLICDTDEFATAMFHEVYLDGAKNPKVFDAALATPADLYIITDHKDMDFEDDGVRYDSGQREWETGWLLNQLPSPQVLVSGSPTQRLVKAANKVLQCRTWDFATPIEYTPGYEKDGIVQSANPNSPFGI